MPAAGPDGLKICTECGETKPISAFGKRKRLSDGLRSQCKVCDSARGKKWRGENKERLAENNRRFRESNPEYGRQWREADPDYFRRYYQEHRESLKARVRQWRIDNPEESLARDRARRARHAVEVAPARLILRRTRLLAQVNCAYCGGPHEAVDHVIPVARGGAHVPENLVSACGSCNAEKWAYPLGRLLDRKPSEDWHTHATQMAASSAASFGLAPVA